MMPGTDLTPYKTVSYIWRRHAGDAKLLPIFAATVDMAVQNNMWGTI